MVRMQHCTRSRTYIEFVIEGCVCAQVHELNIKLALSCKVGEFVKRSVAKGMNNCKEITGSIVSHMHAMSAEHYRHKHMRSQIGIYMCVHVQ